MGLLYCCMARPQVPMIANITRNAKGAGSIHGVLLRKFQMNASTSAGGTLEKNIFSNSRVKPTFRNCRANRRGVDLVRYRGTQSLLRLYAGAAAVLSEGP